MAKAKPPFLDEITKRKPPRKTWIERLQSDEPKTFKAMEEIRNAFLAGEYDGHVTQSAIYRFVVDEFGIKLSREIFTRWLNGRS